MKYLNILLIILMLFSLGCSRKNSPIQNEQFEIKVSEWTSVRFGIDKSIMITYNGIATNSFVLWETFYPLDSKIIYYHGVKLEVISVNSERIILKNLGE
jgi:hypothetical protein